MKIAFVLAVVLIAGGCVPPNEGPAPTSPRLVNGWEYRGPLGNSFGRLYHKNGVCVLYTTSTGGVANLPIEACGD